MVVGDDVTVDDVTVDDVTVDEVLRGFRERRPPTVDAGASPSSVEHDIEIDPAQLAVLEYRMHGLSFAEARARRPDDHRAWVGFVRDRWIKIDAKLESGSSRWSALRVLARAVGRRRGPIVAITGPDGAGKSTLIDALSRSIPAQVRVHYLGRGGGDTGRRRTIGARPVGDGGRGPDPETVTGEQTAVLPQPPGLVAECLFVLRWAARDWGRTARVHLDARLGAVVLCDRHPLEAKSRRRREHDLAHWLEQRLTPGGSGVDLFVLLAGEPNALHHRKSEHDPETLAGMMRALRTVLPPTAVELDATESRESVAAQAAGAILDAWRRTTERHVRSLPALAEGVDRPCLVVDPTGADRLEKLLARADRRRITRLVTRASSISGGRCRTDELRPRSHRPTLSRSSLVPPPTAVVVRTGALTPLDRAIEASGMRDVGPPRIGSGSGLSVSGWSDGRPVLLRLGAAGTAADPTHHATGLEWARTAGVRAPELLDTGEETDHRWSLEESIFGAGSPTTPPIGADDSSALAWIRDMIDVRRVPEPSPLPERQRGELVEHFPRFRTRLDALGDRFADRLSQLGSAPAHGDMWVGNLLLVEGSPVAVDWDAWSDAAVVGLDLVHWHFEQRRRFGDRGGRSLGEFLQRRPWEDHELVATVGTVLGGCGERATVEAIAYCVWLNAATNTLRRTPTLRWSNRWVTPNLVGAIVAFENA